MLGIRGGDPGWFLRGYDLIKLPYLLYVFGKTGLSKQCRSRSDATECGTWSGSTLFATHQTILHTFIGSKSNLLNSSIRGIWIFRVNTVSQISHENEILSQRVGVAVGGWGEGIWLNPTESAPEVLKIYIIYYTVCLRNDKKKKKKKN